MLQCAPGARQPNSIESHQFSVSTSVPCPCVSHRPLLLTGNFISFTLCVQLHTPPPNPHHRSHQQHPAERLFKFFATSECLPRTICILLRPPERCTTANAIGRTHTHTHIRCAINHEYIQYYIHTFSYKYNNNENRLYVINIHHPISPPTLSAAMLQMHVSYTYTHCYAHDFFSFVSRSLSLAMRPQQSKC